MGRLSFEPVMQHFSHPHPLELLQLINTNQFITSPCSSCKLKASGWIYICRPCSYVLHISCAQMPQIIQHSFHPHHPLSLLPLPAYPQGFFNCDACGRRGEGFSYHCSACDVDVHTLCASMPLSISHQAHHHPLALTFYPPYENKGFSCDICSNLGSNHWLYRCSACEFDAHMSCATAKPKTMVQARYPQFQAPQQIQGNGQGSGLADQAVQGFIDAASQQAAQSFVQMITGGGGGGGGGAGAGGGGGGGDGSSFGSFLGIFNGGSGSSGNDDD